MFNSATSLALLYQVAIYRKRFNG